MSFEILLVDIHMFYILLFQFTLFYELLDIEILYKRILFDMFKILLKDFIIKMGLKCHSLETTKFYHFSL